MSIVLTMIVRDEEDHIERCISSARPIIDAFRIVDTGSTDHTRELVREATAGLPGALYEREWVNFGHNRSEVMQLANGLGDYYLWLDGDEVLHIDGDLPPLEAEAYTIRYVGASLSWSFPKLLRADLPWYWEGSVHAIPEHGRGRPWSEELPMLSVSHEGHSKDRRAKIERDVKLLTEEVLAHPEKTRPVFYLAQSHKDLGNLETATAFYRQRAKMGGWPEEVFYATYQAGVCGRDEDMLRSAWALRPTRAEPLFWLARYAREAGRFEEAEMWAVRGLAIPEPSDLLFVHSWIYSVGLAQELALATARRAETG